MVTVVFIRRFVQLFFGLWLYGASMAMMIRGNLGLDPWDVLHQGLTGYLPYSFGTVTIIVGAVVLLLWIPLRQRPGFGTISNVVVIGIATDASLATFTTPDSLVARAALMAGGVVLNGLAGALYIGSRFGPGPRDGLMTGLTARRGWPLNWVRTGIEVTVLVSGWALGGTVGLGTLLYAATIGHLLHFFLPLVSVDVNGDGQNAAEWRRGHDPQCSHH